MNGQMKVDKITFKIGHDMSEYRIYTVAELKEMKVGTVFDHGKFGKCIIMKYRNGAKYMRFKKDINDAWFYKDEHPWTIAMKLLGD